MEDEIRTRLFQAYRQFEVRGFLALAIILSVLSVRHTI